tara:strand:- start:1164 stop:1700 length:537 start_codon:yes stop_codon:yes gene_type:complete
MIDAIAVEILERDDVVDVVEDMGVVTPESFSDQLDENSYEVWSCVEDNVYEIARECASEAMYDHDISESTEDTLVSMLRDYKSQVDSENNVCNTGLAFEEAIVSCIRKAVARGYLGSPVLQDIQTGVNDVHGVRIARLEEQVKMLLEVLTWTGERCASVTVASSDDNQLRIEEVRTNE